MAEAESEDEASQDAARAQKAPPFHIDGGEARQERPAILASRMTEEKAQKAQEAESLESEKELVNEQRMERFREPSIESNKHIYQKPSTGQKKEPASLPQAQPTWQSTQKPQKSRVTSSFRS